MGALRGVNQGLAFAMELVLIAALAYWGFSTDQNVLVRIVLGLGAPALLILFWGLLLAPNANRRLPMPWRLIVKLVLFGLGALALCAAGQTGLAIALAVVTVVNLTLATLWGDA